MLTSASETFISLFRSVNRFSKYNKLINFGTFKKRDFKNILKFDFISVYDIQSFEK